MNIENDDILNNDSENNTSSVKLEYDEDDPRRF